MLFYCSDPAQCFQVKLYKCEGQLSINYRGLYMASVQIHTSGAYVQTLESMSCPPTSQATLLWVKSHVKRRLNACALNVSK
jgi:hypothetical protein